jgi:hypothetical protein
MQAGSCVCLRAVLKLLICWLLDAFHPVPNSQGRSGNPSLPSGDADAIINTTELGMVLGTPAYAATLPVAERSKFYRLRKAR